MEVGNVNSKHFVLALKGKSVLDLCDDENDDMEDNDVNLGSTNSDETDYSFGSDTEVNESQEDQYIVAPAGKQQPEADNGMVDGEIVDKLVKERVLSKAGKNIYIVNKQKATDYGFDMVKEEIEGQAVALGDKTPQVDDHLYSKALYHALRVTYATIPKLESNNLKKILAWSMRVNSPNQELMLLRPAY